jgi:hypothetical protein
MRLLVSGVWVAVEDALGLLNHPGHSSQKSHGRRGFGERFDEAATGAEALQAAALAGEPNADQAAAINRYGGDGGYVINADLRESSGNTGDMQPKNRSSAEQLDSVLEGARLQQDVVVYRHIGSGRRTFGREIEGDLTGLSWRDNAYTSTSAEHRGVTGGHRMNMRILAPRGTPGFSHPNLDSDEILLGRGLTFRVVKDNGIADGVRQLDVVVEL